jgi:two-component system phosphate regulon sensor histidine kinase PhoR
MWSSSLMLSALLMGAPAVPVLGTPIRATSPPVHLAWPVACGLAVVAAAILLVGWVRAWRAHRMLESRLLLVQGGECEPESLRAIPGLADLKGVNSLLADYASSVRKEMSRLALQKKELDVQIRIAEAERRHTEAVIFSISDPVLVISPLGELVLANTAAENQFGFRLSECRRRPVEDVLSDRTLVTLLKEARDAENGPLRRQVEYSTIRESTTQTFSLTMATVRDAEGKVRGVVAVFHDVTRERELGRTKSDFVSAVSHELRTPLSSIKACIELLLDGEVTDYQTCQEFYQTVASETDRLQRLIDSVLNLSRIETGILHIHLEDIPPEEVVREVLETLTAPAARKQITLSFEPEPGVPAITADRDLLHQAVLNVVANAIKYTGDGGRVEVRTAWDPKTSRVSLSVIDNGMGISARHLPRIFEKFYRAREGTAIATGTGLGLNLVKHIVETVHGGEITVASEHGSGTTMVLWLPSART